MIHFWKINFKYLVIAIQYKKFSKNLEKDFRLWKKSETFYFLNGIIDYGSLCIDYESLLKTIGQLLLIRSIYRIRLLRNYSRHTKALDVLRIQKRRGNQNSDWIEFWWEFMKNSPDSKIVEKLSQKTFWLSRKKGLPCSKHGGYFIPIPWRALCGQEIFSMRIEVFSIQVEDIFSTALIKEARIHDYRNQKTPV